jgi:F-type H+-transporting ATPase subunit a
MFVVAVAMLLLLIIIPLAARPKNLSPKGIQNLVESVCVFLREELAKPILKDHTDKYIGFIWTVFFFILSLNLLGMIPSEKIFFLLTGKEGRFGGPATADIWITGAMAIIAFVMSNISGIREQGLRRYITNIAPSVPGWLMPIVYFVEIISMLVRPFTLAIRLFANIVAGHILIATFIGLISVFKNYGAATASVLSAAALSVLELLVAFVQAYIFTFLSALYISFSISPEH